MQHLSLLFLLLAGCASSLSDVTISSLEFGAVEPQRVHHGTVRVTNVGKQPTRLLRIERQSGPDGMAITPAQVRLEAGDTATWQVRFAAGEVGPVEARFLAVFDTGNTSFLVRAHVGSPCALEPFDVGDARVGSSTSTRLTLKNALSYPAEVFVGAPEAPFSSERSGTIRLAAGETREVTITFSPSSPGVIERPWLIAPRTDCTAATTTLRGRAVEAPLVFVPGRLHFGDVPPGSESTRTVEVQNRTRAPLSLASVTSDSAQFTVLTPLPLEVPADGRASLSVRARSNGTGMQSATFTFTTDAAMQAELPLPAVLNRSGPCVTWSPSRIEFGAAEVDCSSTGREITLTNECPHPVELSRPLQPGGFSLISDTGVGPLEAGATRTLQVSFSPGAEGSVSDALRLDANVLDGLEPILVELSGIAAPRTTVEESLVVAKEDPRLDVLFVIDDSPRMLQHEPRVTANLGAFATYLSSNQYETRVAVMSTSTAAGAVGRLRRTMTGAAFLDDPTADQVKELGRVRGEGAGRSSCLEALRAAFAAMDPVELGGFLRPRVPLMVTCITNGRDELETPAMEAIAFIQRKLPPKHAVGVVAPFLDPSPVGCESTPERGSLRAFVSATNGVLEEICTPNWVSALERIGKNAFGYRTDVFVQGQPAFERASLRVWIDDLAIPSIDPDFSSRIWEWNPVLNAVSFEPLYSPEPGRRVTIRYTPACTY